MEGVEDLVVPQDDEDEYFEDSSDTEDQGYDFEYDDSQCFGCPGITSRKNPQLEMDLELLQKYISPGTFTRRSLDDIQQMDLDIMIPTDDLEKSVTDAWGLIYKEPIIVRFSLNQGLYLDISGPIKVEVFQQSLANSGIFWQLKKIIESFFLQQFSRLNNEGVRTAITGQIFSSDQSKGMVELLELGFEADKVMAALRITNGNKEQAVELLLSSFSLQGAARNPAPFSDPVESDPKTVPGLEKGFLVQLYRYIVQRLKTLNDFCPICDSRHDVATHSMLKPALCKNELCIFSHETVGVMADISNMIQTQPEVSNLLVLFTASAAFSPRMDIVLKPYPSIVDPMRPGHIVLHQKKISDSESVKQQKLHDQLNRHFRRPKPEAVILKKAEPDETCQNKSNVLLREVINVLPVLSREMAQSESGFRENLDQRNKLCYPLLQWILNSNRSHIFKLSLDKQLDFMNTPHQFLMRNMGPLEDEKFRVKRDRHGSLFAFHGSPLENWHSIVREGLVVASGTDRQLHGAAYGKGVYLSPSLQLAGKYSSRSLKQTLKHKAMPQPAASKAPTVSGRPGKTFPGEQNQSICIALCEVITDDHLKKHSKTIWTCTRSESICTRFFFLYENYPKRLIPDIETSKHLHVIRSLVKDS